jgi:hypothetical protein
MVFESIDLAHEGYYIIKIGSIIPQLTRNYEAFFIFEVFLYPNECVFSVITPTVFVGLDLVY